MVISIVIISIIGAFLHFLYELSGHNKYVALFAAVNESTWEHIKIALTPMFLWGLYDGFVYGTIGNYFVAKGLSLLTVILVIPILFYSYKSITKKAMLPIDILIFFISIICGQMMFYHFIRLDELSFIYNYVGVILIFIIFGFYMMATVLPFNNFIFKDPISNRTGIKGHTEHHKH